MADNYLEKQYQQYEARKVSMGKSKRQSSKKSGLEKRVFITGGASGIGKAIVKAFSNAGYRVAFCDIDSHNAEITALETKSKYFVVDVCKADELEACMDYMFSEWGDIDIVINNVGVGNFKPITECTVDDFDEVISTNLRPVFITSRKLAIHRKDKLIKNKFGRIINLCSTRYLMSEAGTEGYSASKGGIYSLTHSLAISLSEYNITVNSISPGWIENYNYDTLKEEDHLQHPSRRVGKPEDIARMALFICDEENDFINGENITIDGGMTKKMIYIE
jgi:NAD(P)-dependent dehydrogenase (short-subunit alcohol dehydrogenase family)